MKKLMNMLTEGILLFSMTVSSGFSQEVDVSAKHDWVVTSDPSRPKASNEFDTIVIGSGIGGLSCALLLGKEGYKVLVLEQGSQVGGYCTSYSRAGFTFPVGAHDISGCDNGAVAGLLATLNLKKDDLFALHTRTYMFGDKKITFTGTNNDVVEKLSELFPNEKKNIRAFFDDAKRAFDEKSAQRKGSPLPCPTYEAWQKVTYQQKLDEFFHDAELKKFLCSLIGYIGTKPEETIASDTLGACLSYFIYGGYYPKQGGKLFAEALKQVIESQGGTVLTNARVDEILVTDNHVTGVRSQDKKFLSSIVVANANAKTVFSKLVPQKALDPAFLDAINNLKMSMSLAVVSLGVDLDLSSLSSIIQGYPQQQDGKVVSNKVWFFIDSNVDPSTAPKDNASLSVFVRASYDEVPPSGTPEYRQYKENLAEQGIAKIETVIPGIRKHIRVKDVITPRTFESFTSMPEGALYSFDQSKGSKRPYFKTPIEGLYLASASTYPGAGVEAVVATGMICSRDILRSKKSSGKILLPPPSLKSTVSVEEAIKNRHSTRSFQDQPIPLSDIAQLLWAAQGITHNQLLRAAPSAGALYPLEIYLVAHNVTGLSAGVYKYNVQKAALEKRIDGNLKEKLFKAACSQTCVQQAAADIIICGVRERTAKKYGEKAQQYVDMEAGCVAENIYLQAETCGLGTVFVAGFSPDAVREILGAPVDEQPLCILPLGKPWTSTQV